jgi:hypothetical protein
MLFKFLAMIFYLSENDKVPVTAMFFLLVPAGTNTEKSGFRPEPSSGAPLYIRS